MTMTIFFGKLSVIAIFKCHTKITYIMKDTIFVLIKTKRNSFETINILLPQASHNDSVFPSYGKTRVFIYYRDIDFFASV